MLVLGEIRKGIERIRKREHASAKSLEKWLNRVIADFSERTLVVDQRICEQWGKIGIDQPLPPIDGLLAATALVHDLIFVTRNEQDLKNAGVNLLNPFS